MVDPITQDRLMELSRWGWDINHIPKDDKSIESLHASAVEAIKKYGAADAVSKSTWKTMSGHVLILP